MAVLTLFNAKILISVKQISNRQDKKKKKNTNINTTKEKWLKIHEYFTQYY